MPLVGDEVGSGFLTTLTPPPPPDVSAQPVATVNRTASVASCAASIILLIWPMATSLLGSGLRNSPPGSFLEQGRSDHQPLNLAGSLVDFGDLCVTIVPFGREVGEVAVAGEHLQSFLGDTVGHLGVEQLGHRCVAAVSTAPVLGDGRAPEQQPRRIDL